MTEVQECILNIYKEIKKICEKHNIIYYSIGGTTLGAVRHKGFIPWDDDLDIAVKAEDYLRFIEVCKTELPEQYEVYIPGEKKHWGLNIIKIVDNRTTSVAARRVKYPDSYSGVFVDVMILHGLPRMFVKLGIILIKLNFLIRAQYELKCDFEKKSMSLQVLWLMLRPIRWFMPDDYLWKKYLNFVLSLPFEGQRYATDTGGMFIFPNKWFQKVETFAFEDTTINVPSGWDDYLSMVFGNYMQLPPEDKRRGGHVDKDGILDLHRSFRKY